MFYTTYIHFIQIHIAVHLCDLFFKAAIYFAYSPLIYGPVLISELHFMYILICNILYESVDHITENIMH